MIHLPILAVMLPLGAAFALPLLTRLWHGLRDGATLAALWGTVLVLGAMAPQVIGRGEPMVYWAGGWGVEGDLPLGISLTVDAFALLVALTVAVVSALVWMYTTAYLRHDTGRERYAGLHLLLTAALIGFILSGDLFNQFVYLEILSVASFALTGFRWDDAEGLEAAFKYLMISSVATFGISVGLALLYAETGALNLAHIARELGPGPAGLVGIALMTGGYATKAGLVPWHFWLPDVHTAAPSSFSPLLSGAKLKMGIYAVVRVTMILVPLRTVAGLQGALLVVASLSILVGSVLALVQSDLKRVLAFSSVSQIGYILMGFALANAEGVGGATFHIVNHAAMKALLFLSAGAVVQAVESRQMREMGGLMWRMPVTAACFLVGALAVGGVPPFNGYVSKLLVEEGAAHAGLVGLEWLMIVGSVLTLAATLRAFGRVFLGEDRSRRAADSYRVPLPMLVPQVVLAVACLGLGLWSQPFVEAVVTPAAAAAADAAQYRAVVLEGQVPTTPETLHVDPWSLHGLGVAGGQVVAALALLWLLAHYSELTTANRRWRYVYLLDRTLEIIGMPVRAGVLLLRHAHSGVVNDYILWNVLGTVILTGALVLLAR